MAELDAFDGVAHGADDRAESSVVDILVVYTPAAEESVGSWTGSPDTARAWIEVFNDMAIALTNDAFERSGAFITLNLIGIEKVDYEAATDEEDWFVLLSEDVQDLRDNLGADLVHATVGCCFGGAAIGDGRSYLTAGSDVIFVAHEIGHNFGLSHEHSQWQSVSTSYPDQYKHGYVALRDSRCTSTVMAYGELCGSGVGFQGKFDHIPFFSSPALFYPADGARLGVSRFSSGAGADGPADAVLHLNRVRNAIADFRPSRSPD